MQDGYGLLLSTGTQHGLASITMVSEYGRAGGQAQEQRDAQTVLATMDHADIRGLVTAFHLSVAGLPAL
jgi:hypothetical protein